MAVPVRTAQHNKAAQLVPRPDTRLIRSGRSRRGYSCPVCSREDAQCIAYKRGNRIHAWCIRGEHHAGAQPLEWGFRGIIWYLELDADSLEARHVRDAKTRHEYPVAAPAILDSVLREVAAFYGLSDEHRAKLEARGYDAWKDCGPDGRYIFATLPASPQSRLAIGARLLARRPDLTPADILGVYGFRKDGRYSDAPIEFLPHIEGAALLEFAQDESGHIIGYQYAPDSGLPAKRKTPLRFSISGRYHVARPATDDKTQIWHTEGVHKANLVSQHYNALAASAFGMGNIRGLEAAAKALDPKRRRVHIIALDMEDPASQAGKDVARAVSTLARNLAGQGYRVQLARWPREAGHGPDDAIKAGARIVLVDYESPDKPPAKERRLEHAYEWQRATMPHTAYTGMLEIIGGHMAGRVEKHLKSEQQAAYILAAAPGLGKTHKIAEIGERMPGRKHGRVDIAWIAERLDMLEAVAAFANYRHIETPNDVNCPYGWKAHKALAARGYSTYDLHRNHPTGECDYIRQFKDKGSAIYQLAHVKATYPASHKALVVDEFDLSKWLEEYPATMGRLKTVASGYPPEHPIAVLMTAIQAALTDAKAAFDEARAAKRPYLWPHGRALFDAINARCNGQLATLIGQLTHMPAATDAHPYPGGMDWNDTPDALEASADTLPPVILPHIWRALADELEEWKRTAATGGEWNSNLRLGQTGGGELTLFITEPRRFHDKAAALSLAILDATPPPADILEHVLGRKILAPDIPHASAPAGMRHIAVRTGVRYGKYALTAQHARDLKRTIAQCQYILNQLDPDGSIRASGGVGVVTFDAIEQELCEGLGIEYRARSAHYWACRGANHLEDCPILLCVGTPTLPPDETMRLARAIYRRDPVPLDETPNTDKDGHWHGYQDERLQSLSRYLTYSEITQAAHRNRPLRREARTVVTLCNVEEIGYLPETTTISELPRVTGDGRTRREASDSARAAKLEAAAKALEAEGAPITVSALRLASGVAQSFTARWYTRYREARRNNIMCSDESVPDLLNKYYISKTGTDSAIPDRQNAENSPVSALPQPVNITPKVIDISAPRSSSPTTSFAGRVDQLMAQGYTMEQSAIIALRERGSLPAHPSP